MKIYLPTIFIILIMGMSFVSSRNTAGQKQEKEPENITNNEFKPVHSGIVQELINTVNSHEVFKNNIEKALKTQREESFWYMKTVTDLYHFFDEWLYFLPLMTDARKYIDTFSEFYTKNPVGLEVVRNEPFKSWLSEFVNARGAFMDSEKSAHVIQDWIKRPEIDIDDYRIPPGGFKSFNAFFTRKLKPGRRPVDSPEDDSVLVSPADCTVRKLPARLTKEKTVTVKEMSLNIEQMLGGHPLAEKFINGDAILCGLETPNYHHFHAPVSGKIIAANKLKGLYFGANGFEGFFTEQPRGYFIIKTARFGYIGFVSLGITTISSINFVHSQGDDVRKGDELGYFAYGGSAIVLLIEPGHLKFFTPELKKTYTSYAHADMKHNSLFGNYEQQIIKDNGCPAEEKQEDIRVQMGQKIGVLHATNP